MNFDALIRGGLVFDGTGAPPRLGDVGLRGDRIAAVGDLSRAGAVALCLDADGLALAPGFIDSHTHSDLACLLPAEHAGVAAADVRQGVTVEVSGNCGFSPFPFLPERRLDVQSHVGVLFRGMSIEWDGFAEYCQVVRAAGLYANLAPLLGHGSLRAGVFGMVDRPPTNEELRRMCRLAEEVVEQGAVGISSGLVYVPGSYARTEELVAVCRMLRGSGRPYTSHIRGETGMVADSVREAIRIGQEAGVPVHISHHKAAGKANWGRTGQTLGLIDAAVRGGLDVSLDVYPYTAASTLLYGLLPPWAQEGGLTAMLPRLRNSLSRERIRKDLQSGLPDWENLSQAAGWDGIVIANCPGRPEIEGRTLSSLATDARRDPEEFLFDLLFDQGGNVMMILHLMSEADVQHVLTYPRSMIGSDGIPLPGKPHPRWAGTFSRVLGRYARELHLFDLSTAIQKMTSLPAARFGLRDRGGIAVGKAADLVVFDPTTVIDRASFENPLLQPEGVRSVFVNGQLVVENGRLTGAKPGDIIRPN
jgi:dihydroorotase/N-acyl-D-amino-acid deacylase